MFVNDGLTLASRKTLRQQASLAVSAPLKLHVDMAYLCQVATSLPAFSCQACFAFEGNPIGDAAGSSETTVDQADIRALGSRKTVVRHGAASL